MIPASSLPVVIAAFLTFLPGWAGAQSGEVLVNYDADLVTDPEDGGWTGNEIRMDPGATNALEVEGPDGGLAWQINDQLSNTAFDSPSYTRSLTPSQLREMYRRGWEFTTTVRAVQGNANLAGYVGWTVAPGDNPGWNLNGEGRRMGFYLRVTGAGASIIADQGDLQAPSKIFPMGAKTEYHVIRAVGLPRSTAVTLFVNEVEVGVFYFAESYPGGDASLVSFGSGSSGGSGLVCNWADLSLALSAPETFHVDQSAANDGAADGMSWEHAFPDLQRALRHPALGPGDQIWVAQGTYLPDEEDDESFVLLEGVAVFGGFPSGGGDGGMDARDPNPASNGTVLSGDLEQDDLPEFENRADNVRWVVRAPGLSPGIVLDGFTVCGGGRVDGVGGGMLAEASGAGGESPAIAVTLENCAFSDNINDPNCDLLDETEFAGVGGGGIHNLGTMRIRRCTVSGNAANLGGGIKNDGFLEITESTIFGNIATCHGGGIASDGEDEQAEVDKQTWLINVTVSGNSAGFPDGELSLGGGIAHVGGILLLIHTTVSANAAECAGGLLMYTGDSGSELLVGNSIISGNLLLDGEESCDRPEPGMDQDLLLFDADVVQVGSVIIGDMLYPGAGEPIGPSAVMLAPLGDYGGSTPSMPPLPGSLAIEGAVEIGEGFGELGTDQIGQPRPAGPRPDVGAVEALALGSLGLPSTDGDSIPDVLEGEGTAYPHLDPGGNDSAVDTDGDGDTDAEELANMTNPLDPGDLFRIIAFTPAAGFDPVSNPMFDVTWSSFPGLSYSLESSASPAFVGAPMTGPFTGEGFTHSATVELPAGRGFVRARRD